MWMYFAVAIVQKFREQQQAEKRYYLVMFGSVFTIWFLHLPLMVLAVTAIAEYYRYKVVLGVTLCMQTLAYSFMVFLQMPASMSKFIRVRSKRTPLLPKVETEDALEDVLTPYGSL
jgi:hypothetical protein